VLWHRFYYFPVVIVTLPISYDTCSEDEVVLFKISAVDTQLKPTACTVTCGRSGIEGDRPMTCNEAPSASPRRYPPPWNAWDRPDAPLPVGSTSSAPCLQCRKRLMDRCKTEPLLKKCVTYKSKVKLFYSASKS